MYVFDDTVVPKNTDTGHFTQLIWKETEYLGVGISFHPSRRVYVVCDYYPPGNKMGEFNVNVLTPRKVAKYRDTVVHTINDKESCGVDTHPLVVPKKHL